MPPVIAVRPQLADLIFPPHVWMFVGAVFSSLFIIRSNKVVTTTAVRASVLVATICSILLFTSSNFILIAAFLTIGLTTPVMIRNAFEYTNTHGKSVGQMLGWSSFALEGTALAAGILISFYSVLLAQSLFIFIFGLTLVLLLLSPDQLPERKPATGSVNFIDTLWKSGPAVAGNIAFFLFLEAAAEIKSDAEGFEVGLSVAITGIGFSVGAFSADSISRKIGYKQATLSFLILGTLVGFTGITVLTEGSSFGLYLAAIGISVSNGIIISITLSNDNPYARPNGDYPADMPLIFLIATGTASSILIYLFDGVSKSGFWYTIVIAYALGITTLITSWREPSEMPSGH